VNEASIIYGKHARVLHINGFYRQCLNTSGFYRHWQRQARSIEVVVNRYCIGIV